MMTQQHSSGQGNHEFWSLRIPNDIREALAIDEEQDDEVRVYTHDGQRALAFQRGGSHDYYLWDIREQARLRSWGTAAEMWAYLRACLAVRSVYSLGDVARAAIEADGIERALKDPMIWGGLSAGLVDGKISTDRCEVVASMRRLDPKELHAAAQRKLGQQYKRRFRAWYLAGTKQEDNIMPTSTKTEKYYRNMSAARDALALDAGFNPFVSGGWGRCTKAKLAAAGYVVDRQRAEEINNRAPWEAEEEATK